MDIKDIELVTKITQEQEQLRAIIKKTEGQLLALLAAVSKASIINGWWLELAKQNLLTGINCAISAVSVPITSERLELIKKSQEQQTQSAPTAPAEQAPGEQSEAIAEDAANSSEEASAESATPST